MNYVISHESQAIPVPAEIGADEGKLRRALSSIIPGIAEARVNYSAEKEGVVTITIAKQAGTKGAGPLEALIKCPGGKNPVIIAYEELQFVDMATLSAEEATKLDKRIAAIIEKGEVQEKAMKQALNRLEKAQPQAAPVVILGF